MGQLRAHRYWRTQRTGANRADCRSWQPDSKFSRFFRIRFALYLQRWWPYRFLALLDWYASGSRGRDLPVGTGEQVGFAVISIVPSWFVTARSIFSAKSLFSRTISTIPESLSCRAISAAPESLSDRTWTVSADFLSATTTISSWTVG